MQFRHLLGLIIVQIFSWTLAILAVTSLVWSIKLLLRVWHG